MLRPRERAILRSFARALIPEGGALPPAEGGAGPQIAEPVSRLLAAANPRVRAAARLSLWVLELSPFPRRFTSLSALERGELLARLERARGLRREIFLLLKTLSTLAYARDPGVQAKIGVDARCERAGEPQEPEPRLDRSALDPPEGVERCDVAVVGSGAGGAAAARVLAEAGLDVIVLEEGGYHDAATYPRDPFEALATLYRDGGLTVCEGRPAIPMPLGRCVGGTTVVNSGTCFRTPDDVLLAWREELGIGWATDLDGEFEALERDLDVRPVDPARAGRNAELCRAGAEAIGASNGPIARNAGDVVCCGTCPSGCMLDAKRATHVSELPRAAAAGCRVRAGTTVVRVIVGSSGAEGVECRTSAGDRYEVQARAVVLAAGAIGTPALLLSQGIANASGQVGRNLRTHPACWVGASFDEDVRGWDGVMQSWYVDEWHDRGLFLEATFTPFALGAHWLPGTGVALKDRIERYGRMAVIGVHMSDRASVGRVRTTAGGGQARPRVTYRLTRGDAEAIRFGIARAADIHFAAGAQEVFPQLGDVGSLRPGEQIERVERARLPAHALRLEAFHPMGTARMGSEWWSSVVAPNGETHEISRLYVVDASIFPTSLRVNPMLTIMACARRIARGLAHRLA